MHKTICDNWPGKLATLIKRVGDGDDLGLIYARQKCKEQTIVDKSVDKHTNTDTNTHTHILIVVYHMSAG